VNIILLFGKRSDVAIEAQVQQMLWEGRTVIIINERGLERLTRRGHLTMIQNLPRRPECATTATG
jgi:hypothetical protein